MENEIIKLDFIKNKIFKVKTINFHNKNKFQIFKKI